MDQEGGKKNPWLSHVKKTMRANKGKSLRAVLRMASDSYKKKSKKGGSRLSPLPLEGGKRRRGGKTRRGGRKGGMYNY